MRIEIIDLGMNNLISVLKSFNQTKVRPDIEIIESAPKRFNADLLVLPGVGHFGPAARKLETTGLGEYIKTNVSQGKGLVGICLGMQLLGDGSEESPDCYGLSLVQGTSAKLPFHESVRIPNVGWNGLTTVNHNILPSLSQGLDFYFTHSYRFMPRQPKNILTETKFGIENFVSSVRNENIFGFQFHPEKSGKIGQQLINELIELVS